MTTEAEILAEVKTAIMSILQHGQYISSGGDTYTKADLGVLRSLLKDQRAIASSEGGGSIFGRIKTAIPRRGY